MVFTTTRRSPPPLARHSATMRPDGWTSTRNAVSAILPSQTGRASSCIIVCTSSPRGIADLVIRQREPRGSAIRVRRTATNPSSLARAHRDGCGARRLPIVEGSGSAAGAVAAAFEHGEDRVHFGVPHRVRLGGPAGGRQDGPEVRLGHLQLGLEVAGPSRQRLGAAFSLFPGLPRDAGLLPQRPEVPPQRPHVPGHLDETVDGDAADLAVGGPAGLGAWRPPAPRRLLLAGWPRDGLGLARLHGSGVEQPVLAVHDLEALASQKRPDRARCGQWIRKPNLLADFRRRRSERLPSLDLLGNRPQECIGPAQALVIHSAYRRAVATPRLPPIVTINWPQLRANRSAVRPFHWPNHWTTRWCARTRPAVESPGAR